MDWDDVRVKPAVQTAAVVGEDLSKLSVAELSERVTALERETARVQAEIARRHKQTSAADALFKKSST